MADLPRHPGGNGGTESEREPSARTPVRVYVIGIVVAAVVVLIVVLHLTGTIGPQSHSPSGGDGSTPSSSVTTPVGQAP